MFRMTASLASIPGVIVIGLTEAALAGGAAVPAPIVGAGLPLLVLAAGAYVAVKVIRSRRR